MAHWDPPVVMNLKKIRRLMDKHGLLYPARKANPYRRMAKALKTGNVADNLLKRKFTEYGPRKVLLTDITYIPCNGTFAYLSTILNHTQNGYHGDKIDCPIRLYRPEFIADLAKQTNDRRERAKIARAGGYTVKCIEGMLRKRRSEDESE